VLHGIFSSENDLNATTETALLLREKAVW